MIYLAAPAILAAIYHFLSLLAALRQLRRRVLSPVPLPPVSILKPIHGRDPDFYQAIRSHAEQDYPECEILFGVSDPHDPALQDIEKLVAAYPNRHIRIILAARHTPNGKVGVLADLASQARHSILLVNDSDILVGPDYLRAVVAPLADPRIGLVTCLYRARAASWPARCEALGIATEFAPSVLVARLIGMAGFALGSTMVFRAAELRQIGGFEAIADFLADDYQLGYGISRLGRRVMLSPTVVETRLADNTWAGAWRHQLRWARTARVCRTAGYFGYGITNASVWSLVAAAAGAWPLALAALAVRLLAGVVTGAAVLGDRQVTRYWFLIPLRDLWGFAVWLAGLFGNTVEWRGEKLRLSRHGRITP